MLMATRTTTNGEMRVVVVVVEVVVGDWRKVTSTQRRATYAAIMTPQFRTKNR